MFYLSFLYQNSLFNRIKYNPLLLALQCNKKFANSRHLNTSPSHRHQTPNLPSNRAKRDSFTDGDRSRLRNIGIIAHINAGKTTTTERILYHGGSTEMVGDVDRGNTVTDYLVQERDRGITITSAAVSFNWLKHRVNLIDTPGHVDFTFEVERSLSVLDGAVTILDASAGVEAQTITVWNQASRFKLPNVIFLNKCDKPQADYLMCVKDLKNSLNINAVLVQIPVSERGQLDSIVDVINRRHLTWKDTETDNGSKFSSILLDETENLDKKYIHDAEERREFLINKLSDLDDQFASHVLDCDKISQVSSDMIIKSLRNASLNCELSPVLLGSSFKYLGVQQLMDAIINYLPSPIEREAQISRCFGLESKSSGNNNCAFIFKITHDNRLGPLTYLRVCDGSISKMQRLHNIESGAVEQIKRVYRAFADELREIERPVVKDDIVVVSGILHSKTGDIISERQFDIDYQNSIDDKGGSVIGGGGGGDFDNAGTGAEINKGIPFKMLDNQIIVPQISSMEPVYFCSIESHNSSQQLKLEKALANLVREDPSLSFEIDSIGLTTIRGMGKLHLEIVRDRIQTEYGVKSHLGPMQISYRETINGSAIEEISLNKLINGVTNKLTIKLHVQSKPKAGAWQKKMLRLDYSNESTLGSLRRDFRKAIENGINSAMTHGPQLGYPMIDCDVLLLNFEANGKCGLPVISAAASQCLTMAIQNCSPILLEPIMLLEVNAPKEYLGSLLSDISSSRRGNVINTSARANGNATIRAKAPLSLLANYSEHLRIKTSGRGSFSMELLEYIAMSELDKQKVTRL